MRLYPRNKSWDIKNFIIPGFLFAAIVIMFWYGLNTAYQNTDQESLNQVEQGIKRAAVNCYAIEGSYPAEVTYLKEHYGISIDENKYAVIYESIGSNIMPYIKVVKVGTGAIE